MCRDHCFAEGVVMRAVRDAIVSAPALTITRSEIDELIDGFARCLDLTAADIKKIEK